MRGVLASFCPFYSVVWWMKAMQILREGNCNLQLRRMRSQRLRKKKRREEDAVKKKKKKSIWIQRKKQRFLSKITLSPSVLFPRLYLPNLEWLMESADAHMHAYQHAAPTNTETTRAVTIVKKKKREEEQIKTDKLSSGCEKYISRCCVEIIRENKSLWGNTANWAFHIIHVVGLLTSNTTLAFTQQTVVQRWWHRWTPDIQQRATSGDEVSVEALKQMRTLWKQALCFIHHICICIYTHDVARQPLVI